MRKTLFLLSVLLVLMTSCSKDVGFDSAPTGSTMADIAERQRVDNTAKARPVAEIDLSDYYYWGSYFPLTINPGYDTPSPIDLGNLVLSADQDGFLESATDTVNLVDYDAWEFDTIFQGETYQSVIVLDGPTGPNQVYADLGRRIVGKTITQYRDSMPCEEYGNIPLRGTSYPGNPAFCGFEYDPFTDDRGRLYQTAVINVVAEFYSPTLPVTVVGDCSGTVRTEIASDSITGDGRITADCRYANPFFAAECYGPSYNYQGLTNIRATSDMNSSFALDNNCPDLFQTGPDCRQSIGQTAIQRWYVQGLNNQSQPTTVPLSTFESITFHINGGDGAVNVDCD